MTRGQLVRALVVARLAVGAEGVPPRVTETMRDFAWGAGAREEDVQAVLDALRPLLDDGAGGGAAS